MHTCCITCQISLLMKVVHFKLAGISNISSLKQLILASKSLKLCCFLPMIENVCKVFILCTKCFLFCFIFLRDVSVCLKRIFLHLRQFIIPSPPQVLTTKIEEKNNFIADHLIQSTLLNRDKFPL